MLCCFIARRANVLQFGDQCRQIGCAKREARQTRGFSSLRNREHHQYSMIGFSNVLQFWRSVPMALAVSF